MAGITLNAAVLTQGGRELFCFGLNSVVLRKLSYVTPRSHDDPNEVQRIINRKRAKEIGEYIKKANSLLPNAIVISLSDEVVITESGNEGVKVIHFPSTEGKYAYILDGQHRLAGFDFSDGINYDLPVVAIYNADNNMRGKIFADINSKQETVSDVHLLSLYYQIRDLPVDETPVMDVIIRLNEDNDSPLRNAIKMFADDRGKWVKNTAMKKWLSPHLTTGGVLSTKSISERAQIIKEFFKGVQRTWPVEWEDRKSYSLTKPIGIEIILGIFPSVKHRCDLNCGKQYSAETFSKQMSPLVNAEIELPIGGTFLVDWRRGPMGVLSNAATRSHITKRLRDKLMLADED